MRISKITDRWFDVPNDPDKGRIKIHHLSPGELTDITDKVYKQDVIYKPVVGQKGKVEPIITQDIDTSLNKKLTLTTSVVDWKNFFDREDKPMDCTTENIMRCSREIEGFDELVEECKKQLAEDIAAEKEYQQKNLQSSALQQVTPTASNAEPLTECMGTSLTAANVFQD